MVKYIVKFYRWIFSLCGHDWKIVNTEHWRTVYYNTIRTKNKETKIFEVCQKCKETRTRHINEYWEKEDLM